MDSIEITMVGITQDNLNMSLQVGDMAWYAPISQVSDQRVANTVDLIQIGRVSKIEFFPEDEATRLTVFLENGADANPQLGNYIFFSKNRVANAVAPVGYYAKAKFTNYAQSATELFAVSCGVEESSK